MKDSSPAKTVIISMIALVIWLAIYWHATKVFAPNTVLGNFNSDGAIPVLMSSDNRPITNFNLYYYGAGRWGAWPMLLAQVFRRATGYRWTDQSLFRVQALWLFAGALIIAGLAPQYRIAVGLTYVVTICLHGIVRQRLFDLSMVYPWQITALILAWYCMRSFFSDQSSNYVRFTIWGLLTLWFSFLSIWSSFASTPFLLLVFALEATRSYLAEKKKEVKPPVRRYILASGLVLLAAGAEWLMRMNYHRYNLKHFGYEYRTQLGLDVGHLIQNLESQAQNFFKSPWWPCSLLALLFVLACGFAILSSSRQNNLLATVRDTFADDITILIIGCLGFALINFVLIVIAEHVRLNLYEDRFMTLTYLFATMSGLLTILLILKVATRRSMAGKYLQPSLVAAGLIILTVKFPAQAYSRSYQTEKETAATLESRAPRSILMGGYWQTYVLAGLQSENRLTPVPVEGQLLRTPWTPEALRRAGDVIVEYGQSKIGTAESLPASLSQYGNTLRLVEPRWYENYPYAFALYVKENK